MRIIAEVTPIPDYDKFVERLRRIEGLADAVDLPESPLAKPAANAVAASSLVQSVTGLPAIAHIRLLDLNWIAYRSLLGAAKLLGTWAVVPLQGDPPRDAKPVGEIPTEEAVREARSRGLRVGVIVSVRRDYAARLRNLEADLYLVLNVENPAMLDDEAFREARKRSTIAPYIIFETERNRGMLSSLRQPRFNPSSAEDLVERFLAYADSVIISVPGDYETLVEILRRIAKR